MQKELIRSLKDPYLLSMIPTLEKMLEKEADHLEYLKMYNSKDYPMVELFIENSNKFSEKLKEKIKEYKQYAEKP